MIKGHGTGQTALEKFYIDRKSLPDRVAALAKFRPPASLPSQTCEQFADNLRKI
ncbi:hypothetical protein G9274_002257 [Stenotrophomonas rhizophila]|nr:hypothetical protein G9274_002257 [Stenotrophomonas rhizophila]